tara:strand:- start:889 stop:1485 length:597 start_codon:yes stop_codon:yes gene_type:complete
MVKNYGGNKAKKQGRKFTNESHTTSVTRLSNDADEMYACCSKLFGNGMVGVLCHDGKERICVIRNKFRGRGKRGNHVEIGSWLLVGRRDFEKVSDGKKEKTDLLTVYNNRDITNLKQKQMQYASIFKEFEKFGSVAFDINQEEDDNYEIKFVDESHVEDYYQGIDLPSEDDGDGDQGDIEQVTLSMSEDEEEIDVNDI